MDLITFCVGVAMITMTVVGFKYMLLLQDRYFDRMRDRFDNGDGSLRV